MFQGLGVGDWDGFWAIPYPTHAECRSGTCDSIGREVVASDLYFSFSHGRLGCPPLTST